MFSCSLEDEDEDEAAGGESFGVGPSSGTSFCSMSKLSLVEHDKTPVSIPMFTEVKNEKGMSLKFIRNRTLYLKLIPLVVKTLIFGLIKHWRPRGSHLGEYAFNNVEPFLE